MTEYLEPIFFANSASKAKTRSPMLYLPDLITELIASISSLGKTSIICGFTLGSVGLTLGSAGLTLGSEGFVMEEDKE